MLKGSRSKIIFDDYPYKPEAKFNLARYLIMALLSNMWPSLVSKTGTFWNGFLALYSLFSNSSYLT